MKKLMNKLLILLAGLAIIAMVAVPAIIMQPEDRVNPTAQSVNAADDINAPAVLPQEIVAPTQTPVASEPGITYEIEVEDAMVILTLPSEYEMLPIEWNEINPLPERYEFLNSVTGIKFGVQSDSDNQKNQDIRLSKLHDPANKFTSFSLTCNTYQTWAYFHYDNWNHGFYVIADNGYAYNFYLYLPENQGQNSPPEEALKILETLQIQPK